MHSKVRNIPRNTQLRGRLFDKWPRKGLSGACCGPSGEVSGAPTGRGPACSAARDGGGRNGEVQRCRRGGDGEGCDAGRAGRRVLRWSPGRGQRVQRRRTGAVQGVLRWSRGGASAFSGGARCGTGAEQAGVLRRRRGRGQRVQRRGIGAGRGVQRCRRDGPAAGSQKKCSEGKMRPPPGRKKSVPRGRCAAARTHTGTKKTDLGPFTSISATLRASAPGCSSDTPCRTTTAPHSGSPSLLRETSGSMFSCNSLSAFDFGLPVGRGHSRESLRHPEPQPLSRPPVGAQPPGRRNLSRPGSPRESRSRSGRPRESRRPPPGSQFSAARGHSSQPPSGPISQPSGVSAVRSPELAVPAARPLRRRGHSTTTSVWPSTCNWRISCVELT